MALRAQLEQYDESTIATLVLDQGEEEESTMLAKIATVIHQVKVQYKIHTFFESEKYLDLLDSALLKIHVFEAKLQVVSLIADNPSLLNTKSTLKKEAPDEKVGATDEPPHDSVCKLWMKKHSNLSGAELYKLGRNYRQGMGVAKDAQKAYWCFKMSAEAGDLDGRTGLATCYLDGTGVRLDVHKAFRDLLCLSEEGHAKALVNLGICYFNGFGVRKNIGLALDAFERAAHSGDAQAKCNLGRFHQHGGFVAKDLKQAVRLFREAADDGNSDACYNLGRCYQNGEGVKKNMGKAIGYYKKAADLHNPLALCTLAYCYEIGSGVAKSSCMAEQLYKQAAEKGNPYAKERIEQALNQSQVQPSHKESTKSGWVQDMPAEL